MRRIGGVGAIAALLAAALAGCAGAPLGPPAPRPDATPVAEITCIGAFDETAEAPPPAGGVPDDFDPVALYRCDANATEEDETGTWAGARLERFEGDLEPVLDALAAPNDPRWSGACTAIGFLGPELWAEDGAARFIRLSVPADGCGLPKPDAHRAIEAAIGRLQRVAETFTRSMLVQSRTADAAGCATRAGVLALADASSLETDAASSPPVMPEETNLIPWEPPALPAAEEVDAMHVCVFEAADAAAEATFVRSAELDASDARAAMAAISGAAPAGPACTGAASRLVTIAPRGGGVAAGLSITVELDGCRRMVGPDLRPMSAPDELLAILEAAAS